MKLRFCYSWWLFWWSSPSELSAPNFTVWSACTPKALAKTPWQELKLNIADKESGTWWLFVRVSRRMVWHVTRVTEAEKKLKSLSGLCSFVILLYFAKKYTEYMAMDVRLTSFPRRYQAGREKFSKRRSGIPRRSKKSQDQRSFGPKPIRSMDKEAPRRVGQGEAGARLGCAAESASLAVSQGS